MYIYACTYRHPDGRLSYYVGKHEQPYEKSKWYLGSGDFCKDFRNKYGKEYTKKNVVKKILMHSLPDSKTLCQWEKIFIASYRLIYGGLCKNQTDGGEGGRIRDKTVYHFRNVKTGETFKGTRHKFVEKYSINQNRVSSLICGERNHHRYWVMGDSKIKSIEDIKRIRSEANCDPSIYTFRNVRTNEVFTGTQRTFTEKYNLRDKHISCLIRGKRKHNKYWVMGNSAIKSINDLKRRSPRDMTIYTFRNLNTNQIFTGTQRDFREKYNLNCGGVSLLVNRKAKSVKGWILVTDSKDK